jgi:hypothetical protein
MPSDTAPVMMDNQESNPNNVEHQKDPGDRDLQAESRTAESHLDRWKQAQQVAVQGFFKGQLWFVAKNVIGWLLIILSPLVGALPGPGGIAVFIVGFALVSIPGKRRLTSRVMRGKPVRVGQGAILAIATLLSLAVTGGILLYFKQHFDRIVSWLEISDDQSERVFLFVFGICLLAVPVSWVMVRLGLLAVNLIIRTFPMGRRMARPWLRRRGIHFLPARRALVAGNLVNVNENEIVQISEGTQRRAINAAGWSYRWLRRAIFVGLTVWIFYAIIKPVLLEWEPTRSKLREFSPTDIVLSVTMFAIFLGAVRAMSWRGILSGFGFLVPRNAALRVWILSELARYIPGAIWQVIGRQRLVRPYGVRGSVCASSQVLELTLFVLANLIVAIIGMFVMGIERLDGRAQQWLWAALLLAPLLAVVLHPPIFYGVTNRILRSLKKPVLASRLSLGRSAGILLFMLLGLLWQSVAIWLLLRGPLGLSTSDIGLVAGAYSLAWTAGFIAVWAPGGIGVREAVLIGALAWVLPTSIKQGFGEAKILEATSLLLRGWTIVAEVLVTIAALMLDPRGSLQMLDGYEPVEVSRGDAAKPAHKTAEPTYDASP